MQIIAGSLKGRSIPTVKNVKYRPSTGRFKEALFSILTSGDFKGRLDGAKFLDLYSGSCSVGFEAVSRGAGYSCFVDTDRKNLEIAEAFAEKVGISSKTKYICSDATNLRYTNEKYDIIFIDPPYKEDMVPKTLASLFANSWISNNALVIIEIGEYDKIEIPPEFETIINRKYGGSRLIILEYKEK